MPALQRKRPAGRILAPAVAGHFYRRGEYLQARIQPRLEGGLMVLLGIAVLAQPLDGAAPLTGVVLLCTAALAALRLARWRLWRCLDRADLLCLGGGYGWLIAGLVMLGSGDLLGRPDPMAGIHAITVGGLGTLTATVMIRTRRLKAGREPAAATAPWVALLLAAAAAARIDATPPGLIIAAALWSAAFLLTGAALLRIPSRP